MTKEHHFQVEPVNIVALAVQLNAAGEIVWAPSAACGGTRALIACLIVVCKTFIAYMVCGLLCKSLRLKCCSDINETKMEIGVKKEF